MVDLALEGSTHDLPSPSISALASLNKQLAELEIKAQQKAFEQQFNKRSRGGRRGRGPGHGDSGASIDVSANLRLPHSMLIMNNRVNEMNISQPI